jgi:hypothetical protein
VAAAHARGEIDHEERAGDLEPVEVAEEVLRLVGGAADHRALALVRRVREAPQRRRQLGVTLRQRSKHLRRDREEPRGAARDGGRAARAAAEHLHVAEEVAAAQVRAHVQAAVFLGLDLHEAVGDEPHVGRGAALIVDDLAARDGAVGDRVEQRVEARLGEIAREGQRAQQIARRGAREGPLDALGHLGLPGAAGGAAEHVHRDLGDERAGRRDRRRAAGAADRRLLAERAAGLGHAQLGLDVVAALHGAQRDLALGHDEERVAGVARAVHGGAGLEAEERAGLGDLAAGAVVEAAEDRGASTTGGHLSATARGVAAVSVTGPPPTRAPPPRSPASSACRPSRAARSA